MRSAQEYRTNDRISVVYDPANPKRVDLRSAIHSSNPDAELFALGKLGSGIVLMLIIPGVVLIVGARGGN